jgi:hypothetical protein
MSTGSGSLHFTRFSPLSMFDNLYSYSKRGSVDKGHPQLNVIRTRDLRLLKVMGYMIKGMMPIIETTNSILKATHKKESFEPAKNLRKTSDGLRMLSAPHNKTVFQFRISEKPPLKPLNPPLTQLPESLSSKLDMIIFLNLEMSSIFF